MFSNPAESFATEIFTAEPGDYEAVLTSVSARAYEKDGELQSYIISFNFRINEGEFKGNRLQSYDCWIGTEDEVRQDGINNMMKPILALCGITPGARGSDDAFRSGFGHLDLSFNPAEKTFASGWDAVKGQALRLGLGKTLGKDGNTYQKFARFMPING